MAIHMGYMGQATIDGTVVKITSSSINPVQVIEAPELVQGDFVKKAVNYGKIETGGNIAGPVAENSIAALWADAIDRTSFGDQMAHSIPIDILYYKGGGRSFADCQLNTFQISVTAGDVAQFTIDFMGTTSAALLGPPSAVSCEKLVTWDKCSMTCADLGTAVDQIQSYTFSMGNALQRVYKIKTPPNNLFPAEILAGMQVITGSVSFYADDVLDTELPIWPGGKFGADSWDDYTASASPLSFGAGPITANAYVMWNRPEANAQTGPAIYTVAFTGVCTSPS